MDKKNFPFLDFKITWFDRKLKTSVYVKPSRRYKYLNYSFYHLEHPKRSTAFSKMLPII